MRLASVIASRTAGGIGPVCGYTAEAIAALTGWDVTLVALHDSTSSTINANGIRIESLGLTTNTALQFFEWLSRNPQDVLVTGGVSGIEPAYRYIPAGTAHILQIHDSARKYRQVAVRHAAHVDGVACVGRYFEAKLADELKRTSFQGILRTIHNGARFPELMAHTTTGDLRLLFMGSLYPLKGIYDLPPLMHRLRLLMVPARLKIVGGRDEMLDRQMRRLGIADAVEWTGRLPHAECYRMAAESDIFLMLSRKEAFGMATIEAMSMGAVPIAYDLPSGSREIIEHDRSGLLVPPGRLDALADTLASLHRDRSRLARLSAGAIDRARTAFGIETTARNMMAFIEDVQNHRRNHMPRRDVGVPPESEVIPFAPPRRGYQKLPKSFREQVHRTLCSFPRLANYIYNR